ncbi:MAG: hypothetical protein ACK5TC_00050, partial [bacterium]
MVDVALHDGIAYPAVVLMQVHVVVGWQEANRTTMVGPQLVNDQAFIATEIVLASRRQKVTDDFGKHGSKGFGSIEIQSAVGMRPSRRCHDVATSCPFFVRHLIPAGAIYASLWALATGDHREVSWCDEVEGRWAVATDDHVVVELENMAEAKERLHVIADKYLLPERR